MRNFLVMQTDFSLKSAAVSVMHGVSYQVDRDLVVEDISHEVAKWNPYAASTNLAYVRNSTTRPDSASPISPRSLLRTLFSAFSEKLAIFCCAPAPYIKI